MRTVLILFFIFTVGMASSLPAQASRDVEIYWTTFANSAEIGASLCVGALVDIRRTDLHSFFHNYKIVLEGHWRGFQTFFRSGAQGSPYLHALIESDGYWEALEDCFGPDPEKWIAFTNMLIYSEGVGAVAGFVLPFGVYRLLAAAAPQFPLIAKFLEKTRGIRNFLKNPYTTGFLSLNFALRRFGPAVLQEIARQNLAKDPDRFLEELRSHSGQFLSVQSEALSRVLVERAALLNGQLQKELDKPEELQNQNQITQLQEQILKINQALDDLAQ